MSKGPGPRRPYRHRTPGRGWMRFAAIEDRHDKQRPMRWLRRLVAKFYGDVEKRLGVHILREERIIQPPLGCGMFGCVFALSDGRVLKITSDASEGPMSLYIRQLQQSGVRTKVGPVIATTARIDDVFVFPDKALAHGETTAIYGIVREQTGACGKGLGEELVYGVNVYTDGWDSYCEADFEGTRNLGAALARAGLSVLGRSGIKAKRLAALLSMTWEDGLPLMDVHSDNLALRIETGPKMMCGQVIIFDFGGSQDCKLPSVRGARRRPMVVQDKSLLESLRREIPKL